MRPRPGRRQSRARPASTSSSRSTRAASPCGLPRRSRTSRRGAGAAEGGAAARPQRPARARRGKEALSDSNLNGFDPARAGVVLGSAIGGFLGIMQQHEVMQERGADRVSPYFLPSVLVDSASGQLAISLGLRGPNYAPVSACATGSHAVGEGAEIIRRGDADVDPRRRHRGLHAPADPRRLLRHARARRRGGVPAARLAPVRCHPRRVRDGRGRLRARPRGARGGAGPRRHPLRRGARLRRLERRVPHGRARPGVGRRRRDDARGARARGRGARPRSATSTPTAPRRRSATSPRRRRSRKSSATTPTSWPSRPRSR